MKKYLIYKKKTKQVEMISDGKDGYDKSIFSVKEMDLTKKELEDIYNSERTLLINGKLVLTPRVDKKAKMKELELELEKATDLDKTKELIKKLINL